MGGSGSKTEARTELTQKTPKTRKQESTAAAASDMARQVKSAPINSSKKPKGKTVPKKKLEASKRIRNAQMPMPTSSLHFNKRKIESAPLMRNTGGNASSTDGRSKASGPRTQNEITMAEPLQTKFAEDDAQLMTELNVQKSTKLLLISSDSSLDYDSGPEITLIRRPPKTSQNKPKSLKSTCLQYNQDIDLLHKMRCGPLGNLEDESAHSLYDKSDYQKAHDRVVVSNKGKRMSAAVATEVEGTEAEEVQTHDADTVEENEPEFIEIKGVKKAEIRKLECTKANVHTGAKIVSSQGPEGSDTSESPCIKPSEVKREAVLAQNSEAISSEKLSHFERTFDSNSWLQKFENIQNQNTDEQERLLNILNIDRHHKPKQKNDKDKLSETHRILLNHDHDPNNEIYKVKPEDDERLELKIKYCESRNAYKPNERTNSSKSWEGFQFIEDRMELEQKLDSFNDRFENTENLRYPADIAYAERDQHEDLSSDEVAATPTYISFREPPKYSAKFSYVNNHPQTQNSSRSSSRSNVNRHKFVPNTKGKLRTTPTQRQIQDRQRRAPEPCSSTRLYNHVSNEIQEESQNVHGQQDSAPSTARRKLIIRGLRNFKESRGAGCPPTWVKEFPCRSKFHPDHYIYDFDEGILAPKRNVRAMHQCPKRGGRCIKCGVCTIDLCPKCSNCEDDCGCPNRQRQPIPPGPNIFNEYGVTNPMESLGSVLTQAKSMFHGNTETRGLPYPFNTGPGRISGAPPPPNYFPPPPPPPLPYGGTSYYPCPYPQLYMYGPPPPCFYPPPPPGYFQGQPPAPPPMMPPYGYPPGIYCPPPSQDPYPPSYSSNVTFNNPHDMPKFNE